MAHTQIDQTLITDAVAKIDRDGEHLAFAQHWLKHFPIEEFGGRSPENIVGWMTDLAMQFVDSKQGIKVYNPKLERHGWQASNTIVFVNRPDIPFLIDSLRIALDEAGLEVRLVHSQIIKGEESRAVAYFEIGRREQEAELENIQQALLDASQLVESVVGSFGLMRDKIAELLPSFNETGNAHELLDWLRRDHFIFIGYARWKDGEYLDTIGALADPSIKVDIDLKSTAILTDGNDISFNKSSRRSRVHRHVYADYVVIRDPQDPTIEHRFKGLFTASVYQLNPWLLPVVRDKMAAIEERIGVSYNSHDGKTLRQLLTTYPTDELFQTSLDDLTDAIHRALRIQERPLVRVVLQKEHLGRFVSCVVYVPRERYNTQLRVDIQNYLTKKLNAIDSEFTTYFSESVNARVHVTLRTRPEQQSHIDLDELENTILEMCREWQDRLKDTLFSTIGDERGSRLASLYNGAFPAAYREDYDTRFAAQDIKVIDDMAEDDDIAVNFYQSIDSHENQAHFRVYKFNRPIGLSEVLPTFENLGWRVIGEQPYQISRRAGDKIWLHDFIIEVPNVSQETIASNAMLCQEAFEAVWSGQAENDSFNRLALHAGLNWRQVSVLRAYARYLRQIKFNFSLDYVADTLVKHADITCAIAAYFDQLFNPAKQVSADDECTAQAVTFDRILSMIEGVDSLDEDRILQRILNVMNATVRTNFYRPTNDNTPRSVLSLKLDAAKIEALPKPVPYFEIFVSSPRTEGVHLRGGPVARGGLRWSDRPEDFRTEVLGLVKAQQVKNAVIVPVGAKGGFVARQTETNWSRERLQEEGIACYKEFISGLLDITDNRSADGIVKPEAVVCRDNDDPYLVVAADKGTATFSDIANGISADYDFWLGDAFASGGSNGYDHKKMGITAKGAWVSVQRHFNELGLDVQSDPVTVLGIGDMSGDVFGNGMLLSRSILLVAGFNHRHIFIDPNPDAEASYLERERLFALPRSGWNDYDTQLISKGGGVFDRSAKSIRITPEMRKCFNITETTLRPTDLINRLLKAELDLLWNGGIGTYVKASTETHSKVGDKANDLLRVDGTELGARVVGEGGNLGLTQFGRVEYAMRGGRINTDFIDNVGGVDCSDHEVNIKILMNQIVSAGQMTEIQRNEVLEAMTDEVSTLVLGNNYRQALAISLEEAKSMYRTGDNRRFLQDLEAQGILDRALENLPSDTDWATRCTDLEQSLSRPELSVLLSYAKSTLKTEFAIDGLVEGHYRDLAVQSAFPQSLQARFSDAMSKHRLNNEIVATQLANEIVNYMGITFAHRLKKSTGACAKQVARAWIFCRETFQVPAVWKSIENLNETVESNVQLELMEQLRRLIRRAARWFIHNERKLNDFNTAIETCREVVNELSSALPSFLPDSDQQLFQQRYDELKVTGLPNNLAALSAGAETMFAVMSVHQITTTAMVDTVDAARLYFQIGGELRLSKLQVSLTQINIRDAWEAMAREGHLDQLERARVSIACSVIKFAQEKELALSEAFIPWAATHNTSVAQWRSLIDEMESSHNLHFAAYSVADRSLMLFIQQTQCD